jgi:uncharacterized membrane protein YkvA (DUF1232 family)
MMAMEGETLRPDEVIEPGRSVRLRKVAADAVSTIPNLVKLLTRLLRDPRVPRRTKIVLAAALGYMVSPVDVVPDFIPGLGAVDDLLLMAFAVNHLVHVAGEEVVLEHWDGPRDLLELVRAILDVASDMVPVRLRRLIARLSAE